MKTFAERLKYAMTEAGMNQITLAAKSGASPAAISGYCNGEHIPAPDRIKVLAEATGSSFDFLMGYEVSQKKEFSAPVRRITIALAARCLGKSEQFIRIGLQRGLLPFGTAVPGSGNRWNYDIRPKKFREYVGAEQFDSFFGQTSEE